MKEFSRGGDLDATHAWIQKNNMAYGKLKVEIRKTAPIFVPWSEREVHTDATVVRGFINSLEDGEEDSSPLSALGENASALTLTEMRRFIVASVLILYHPFTDQFSMIAPLLVNFPIMFHSPPKYA